MTDLPFRFDEIGDWSVLKLEIVEKVRSRLTRRRSMSRTPNLKKYYIDGFSGAGVHVVEENAGSRSRAARHAP